jgi:hypothetical protein
MIATKRGRVADPNKTTTKKVDLFIYSIYAQEFGMSGEI